MIWRIRDRATFSALARARRRSAGPVWLRCLIDGSSKEPRVAYAISRRVGSAVVRNRARRRLRAAVVAHAHNLVPGTAYLFGAGADVVTLDFEGLTRHVGELIARAREEQG